MADSFKQLTTEIGMVVTRILRADLALLAGYSQAKAQAVARFTLALGEGYAAGTITEAEMAREKEELERMVIRFVRNIQALATVTIERLISGVAEVLTAVLRRMTGLSGLMLGPAPTVIWGVGAD
ncbi:MAG TPA: hypothetical protein VMM59_12470 [Thermohalobaculum sp.]|nr:hypothetical protein [Thermohalobaculum sp.]